MDGDFVTTFDYGIEARLECLFQYRTYSGLPEGVPTRRLNRDLCQRALSHAKVRLWMGGDPYLVEPTETALGIPKERWFRPDDEPAMCPAWSAWQYSSQGPSRGIRMQTSPRSESSGFRPNLGC